MKLAALIPDVPPRQADVDIAEVTADSRKVKAGFLFVAIPGVKADGSQFIHDAIARGASAVLTESESAAAIAESAPIIRVADTRAALSRAAAALHPRQPETIVAVTGTSGKTSVADFARQIFAADGKISASVGTLGVIKSDGTSYGSLTTPDPVTLHKTLDSLAGEGVTHLAMEASSHGLDQKRLDGVKLKSAAFTNLGRDHLDYHPTVEDYLVAKLRLFTTLLPADGVAMINRDGDRAGDVERTARARGLRIVTVGRAGKDIRLVSARREGFAQALAIEHAGRTFEARLPLIGEFQVSNALTAAGLALSVGASADRVFAAFDSLRGVPGRLETIGEARGGVALVDYSHKPDALATVLGALRPFASGRLVVVFGCGGDRDRGKRPLMGSIAVEKADRVIVTDDNPRSEEPAEIRRQVLAAAPGAIEIGDRAEAIHAAVADMSAGDVVLIAGKGHETGQIIGDRVLPFSDHEVVRAALRELGA
ncbi:UDP-N-acetylmuramoyl-L-alanyl-D-glutamate--2,6-diaminopimelate ligase [Terrarubrum flagellatum]|uniref:UDP-N-acetylmuramoyl-L-alanyl-D-glutamate--2, 6-diaminopimelate ligase n=1 Tax=Terrirubrum flagellatum TaxID=2895980 RepID=UPI003144E526